MSSSHHFLRARLRLTRGAFRLKADLALPMDGVTALFGPSGCGKTSLLRALAGLERDRHRGYVRFGQEIWQDEKRSHYLPIHQRPVGVVFQEPRLFGHLTVRNNLIYGWRRIAPEARRVSLDEIVEILRLAPLMDHRPHHLSGGEKQRVSIGRALLTAPRLLLMDEPLASLDHEHKGKILGFIRTLYDRLRLPMLYVTHDMGEILQLANNLVLMEHGEILASGPLGDIMTRLDLPIAHTSDAGTVIDAAVTRQDPRYHLNYLDFFGGQLIVTQEGLTVGDRVRVHICARDVSLTLDSPQRTSILNILPATITELTHEGAHRNRVMVKLTLGDATTLLARVTELSRETLKLHQGMRLYAQVKSVALESDHFR